MPFPPQMCHFLGVYNTVTFIILAYLTSSGMWMGWLTPTTGAESDLEEFDNGHFTEMKNTLHLTKVGEVLTLKRYLKSLTV